MNRRSVARISSVALLATVILNGCATFQAQRRVDLAPFAEEMITLAGELQYGVGQINPVYIRQHIVPEDVAEVGVLAEKVRAIIRGTIAYSMQLVTLADSDMPGPEQAAALANYLDGVLRPILSSPRPDLDLTIAQLDTIVSRVGRQATLLDALKQAQPVIDESSRASQEVFDDMKISVDRAAEAIRARIEEDNAGVQKANSLLKKSQVGIVSRIEYISRYRRGEPAALDTLYMLEPSLEEVAPRIDGRVPAAQMAKIEERMLFMLRSLSELREQLYPDLELYWKQQQELDRLVNDYSAQLRKANVAVIAWARAHERLAAGVLDPAKIDLMGIARGAAGAANPLQ